MPQAPSQVGPPTEYALKQRPWLLVVLVLQTICCVFRAVVLLDIMGAFIMMIATMVGWKAWQEDMHITLITYWGIMCLINGVFDAARTLDLAVHSPKPLLSAHEGFAYNLAGGVLLTLPVSALVGACSSWYLYADYTAHTLPHTFAARGDEPMW